MRTKIGLIAALIYAAIFNFYLYALTTELLHKPLSQTIYVFATFCLFCFYCWDIKRPSEEPYHDQVTIIVEYLLKCNFILILICRLGLINQGENLFWWFNGSVVVVTLMVLYSANKHGYFKK